jgi:hypothetical protein
MLYSSYNHTWCGVGIHGISFGGYISISYDVDDYKREKQDRVENWLSGLAITNDRVG